MSAEDVVRVGRRKITFTKVGRSYVGAVRLPTGDQVLVIASKKPKPTGPVISDADYECLICTLTAIFDCFEVHCNKKTGKCDSVKFQSCVRDSCVGKCGGRKGGPIIVFETPA